MRSALLACVLLTATGAAFAHHSFAVFFNTDDKVVKVSGVVKEFSFSNPHGVIALEVPGTNGSIEWRAETNSPSLLRRRGWSPDSLHVGDRVTVEGWPARDGTRYLRMRAVYTADGRPVGQPLG